VDDVTASPHIQRLIDQHSDQNKRLSPQFFFTKSGKVRKRVLKFIKSKQFDIIGLPYSVECPNLSDWVDNDTKWEELNSWLRENCKSAWFLLINHISFFDKADATLFKLWWSCE
jgi:hypothetical protein